MVHVAMGIYQHVLVWQEENNTLVYNISTGLSRVYGIFATSNGDIYTDNGADNYRLDMWPGNTTSSVAVVNVTSRCFSLFIDIYGALYCSFTDEHKVTRIILNDGATIQTTIAGNGTSGSQTNMLTHPNGIFLDESYNLYVADYGNHRIQKFPIDQLDGITVAGNGTPGLDTLNHPTAVLVDADGYLYICDTDNHRIVKSGPSGLQCIVGCTGSNGSAADQLSSPHSISFDSYGNLFVVDSANNRIQKFLLTASSCSEYLLSCSSDNFLLSVVSTSYNQPKFSVCATWNPYAVTFADNNTVGSLPTDVFVDTDNTVYVVSGSLNSVLVWSEGSNIIARNLSDNLTNPHAVFTTNNDDIYVSNDVSNRRLQKWSSGGTNSLIVMNISSRCFSFFIDVKGTLYCSLDSQHLVVTMSLSSQSGDVTIIAGNGTSGAATNMLYSPNGIFVDRKFNLYVADCWNHRIQLFPTGQSNGTTVVGARAPGTMPLTYPSAVLLDADNYIFVADENHRIIRSGPSGTQCVLGCTGIPGSAPNQLNKPYSMSFDSYGNLFVADLNNSRIQKFLLAINTCGKYIHIICRLISRQIKLSRAVKICRFFLCIIL